MVGMRLSAAGGSFKKSVPQRLKRAAENLGFVSGHDFSRAVND